jgi:hypothetical protein
MPDGMAEPILETRGAFGAASGGIYDVTEHDAECRADQCRNDESSLIPTFPKEWVHRRPS